MVKKRQDKKITKPNLRLILGALVGAGIVGAGAYQFTTPDQRRQFTNMFDVPVSQGIAGIKTFRRGVQELRGIERDIGFISRL